MKKNFGNYRKTCRRTGKKNEDYFKTTFEAVDILHEINLSSSHGEKKAHYTRFFIGNEKHG